MLPDRVSNPRPLTYESGALPIALRGPAQKSVKPIINSMKQNYRSNLFKNGSGEMILSCISCMYLAMYHSLTLTETEKYDKIRIRIRIVYW